MTKEEFKAKALDIVKRAMILLKKNKDLDIIFMGSEVKEINRNSLYKSSYEIKVTFLYPLSNKEFEFNFEESCFTNYICSIASAFVYVSAHQKEVLQLLELKDKVSQDDLAAVCLATCFYDTGKLNKGFDHHG